MKTCPKCGEEVIEDFDTCFACGESLVDDEEAIIRNHHKEALDAASLVFVMIALFFPLIGLLVAFVVQRTNKRLASLMFLAVFISVVFYSMIVFFIALLMAF